MEFQDKTLNCVDCGTEFLWTAGEQLFFADKNFKNEPKRCKSCTRARRDNDELLGMRQGDNGPVPSHPGTACLLPRMLPATEVCRRCRRLTVLSFGSNEATRRAWPFCWSPETPV